MLKVFLEDKELFEDKIELIISDNCSEQDNAGVCAKYRSLGLNVDFRCNATNIGGDANIMQGFKVSNSHYVWVLGSDDIPVFGFLRKLMPSLETKKYGVIHIDYVNCDYTSKEYSDINLFAQDVFVNFTFISGNIVKNEYVEKVNFDKYIDSNLSQYPLYLEACSDCNHNLIVSYPWMQSGNDYANNGGYNIFKVFVQSFLDITKEYVDKGILSPQTFKTVKWRTFNQHIRKYIYGCLLLKENANYETSSAWQILCKYYGNTCYFYFYVLRMFLGFSFRKMLKKA